MLTRKIGSLLRGQATPFQIVTASVLGAMIGFAPSLQQAPGLYAILLGALLIANANLGLALLVAGVARVLSWALLPTSFAVGEFLLDGPTHGVAAAVVHAPILAWCGLTYYAVAGGQVVALVLGLITGLSINRGLKLFRLRMAAAEGSESKLSAIAGKRWARALMWLFFGGKGKKSWAEKAEASRTRPVRLAGVAAVGILFTGVWFAQRAVASELARESLEHKLETMNGATVDVGAAHFDLVGGVFGFERIALADREELERDLFSATEIVADFDQVDLLRRRVHVARLVVADAKSGGAREVPGVLHERAEVVVDEPAPGADGAPPTDEDLGTWDIDELLEDAEVWRSRLAQAQSFITRFSKGEDDDCVRMPCGSPESHDRRVQRITRESGLLRVESERLAPPAPTFRVSELAVEGLVADWLPGAVLDLRATELSNAPWLVDGPPTLELSSRDRTVGFAVNLAPASRGGGLGGLRFHWRDLAVDDALAMLSLEDAPPLRGGTIDLELEGAWAKGEIGALDLPLRATIRGTTVSVDGLQDFVLDEVAVPIHLTGTLTSPVVHFDAGAFTDSLVAAGQEQLGTMVRDEAEKRIDAEVDRALDDLRDSTGVDIPKDLDGALEKGADELLKGGFGGLRQKR